MELCATCRKSVKREQETRCKCPKTQKRCGPKPVEIETR